MSFLFFLDDACSILKKINQMTHRQLTDQIEIFCKNTREKTFNWPNEVKIFKKLLKVYLDFEFWQNLNLGFKLNSMAWFLTTNGKNFLCQKFNEKSLDQSNKTEYYFDNENFVIENSAIEEKPKTAMEFLKN